MMVGSLREFVEFTLLEITRYKEEMGEEYDFQQEIRKYISKSHPTRYAFTMTEIPKVGLNPKTSFNTPAGVYAFQLNLAYYRKLIEARLPYVNDAPYCNIMKLNFNSGKWLITSSKGLDRATAEDVQAVRQKVGEEVWKMASSYGSHWSLGNDSKIYDLTYWATKTKPHSTVAWANLLRELGYIGIYDPGNSVIHKNEPMQLVCLTPAAYEWVETYETRSIRRDTEKKIARVAKPQDAAVDKDIKSWAENWEFKDGQYANNSKAMRVIDGSIQADPETVEMVFDKSQHFEKYGRAARNPNAPPSVLKKVWNSLISKLKQTGSVSGTVFIYLYNNPNCPPEAWDQIDEVATKVGISEILSSPKISAEKLIKIFEEITGGKDLKDMFSKLDSKLKASDWDIKENLGMMLKNPNLPEDLIRQAIKSGNNELASKAMQNPNLPDDQYDFLIKSLKHSGTSPQEKKSLFNNLVLRPSDAIEFLKTETPTNIFTILQRTLFSPEVLDALSKKYTKKKELSAIILNKNVSIRLLRRLMQHPDPFVRLDAKSRLASKTN